MTAFDKPRWKENWREATSHFDRWWRRKGPVLQLVGLPPRAKSRDGSAPMQKPLAVRDLHTEPKWFAWNQRHELARQRYPADNLPIAHVDYGCVQLAACFGAEPEFAENTVWYSDCISKTETCPPLKLRKTEKWWRVYKSILLALVRLSDGDFLIGAPAFGSNLDVLAELRGTQNLLYDLSDRPDWVHEKLEEINQAFFVAFDDYYQQIKLSDGSSAYAYFHLWGPGKTSQVQCDFAAMISPAMFEEFVVPSLRRQCAWLDHSLFHLDGPSCICHLDHLLGIPELDAVQWTPGAGQPGAGDEKWFELYRRILAAGKSAQILGVEMEQARRLLDTFGPRGMYLAVFTKSEAEAEEMIEFVNSMRPS